MTRKYTVTHNPTGEEWTESFKTWLPDDGDNIEAAEALIDDWNRGSRNHKNEFSYRLADNQD